METSHWRCDERAAEVAGANAPAEEEEELGDGHEEEYEEEYEEDGSDGRAHTPLCSKLRDAVDHAGLNDFMRVILEPLEDGGLSRPRGNHHLLLHQPPHRHRHSQRANGDDEAHPGRGPLASCGEAGQRADGARHAAAH